MVRLLSASSASNDTDFYGEGELEQFSQSESDTVL